MQNVAKSNMTRLLTVALIIWDSAAAALELLDRFGNVGLEFSVMNIHHDSYKLSQ